MKDFLYSLQTSSWRTAGCRYNAYRRLKRREFVSIVSLAFFSALTVALAFLQKTYSPQSGSAIDNYLTALSACLGIFLLAISLIEWGAGNGLRADMLYKNAEQLNAHSRKVAQVIAQLDGNVQINWGAIDKLRDEYEGIKVACPQNHEPLDDQLFLAQHRNATEFFREGKPAMTAFAAWCVSVEHRWSSVRAFVFYWVVVLGLIAVTPWFKQ